MVGFAVVIQSRSHDEAVRRRTTPLVLTGAALTLAMMFGVGAALTYDGGTGLYGCTRADRSVGDQLASDAAMRRLALRFTLRTEPKSACDDDDRSVSVDVELATVLPEEAALRQAATVMEAAGWAPSAKWPRCFDKRVGGRLVRAQLAYQVASEDVSEAGLSVSLLRIPGGCAHG